MKHIRLYVLGSGLLFVLFMNKHALAEMYKWVDKFGIIHIQDSPPKDAPDTAKIKRRGKRNSSPGARRPPAATSSDDSEKTSELKPEPKVELFVTRWCPASQQALKYFKSKGIPFTAYDVEKDSNALRRQKEINPRGSVPTVVINGKVFDGYNADEFDQMLR